MFLLIGKLIGSWQLALSSTVVAMLPDSKIWNENGLYLLYFQYSPWILWSNLVVRPCSNLIPLQSLDAFALQFLVSNQLFHIIFSITKWVFNHEIDKIDPFIVFPIVNIIYDKAAMIHFVFGWLFCGARHCRPRLNQQPDYPSIDHRSSR